LFATLQIASDEIGRDRTTKWQMNEVIITIRGKRHWLWLTIDAKIVIFDILVQKRKGGKAVFLKILFQFGEPKVVISDKLRNYIKPIKTLAPEADHRAHKSLNNAIEVLHQPTNKREKIFGRFKSHRQAQRFLSAQHQIKLIFRPHHNLVPSLPQRCVQPLGRLYRQNGSITQAFPILHNRPPTTWQYPKIY
jgi:transposase-like protein